MDNGQWTMDNGQLIMESEMKKDLKNNSQLLTVNSQLPEGWEVKKFEQCIEKVVYTNKIKRKEFLINGEYPIISQEQDLITGYWNNSADLFKIKKPVVIFGDHTKIVKYIDFNFVLGADGVKILQPKNGIDSKYFYYYLQNVELGDLGYARHYRLLKEIDVFYPKSLKDQKRIVAILDRTFEAIDKAKANAEQNLKNAKELFESYLNRIFEEKGEDWEGKTLGEVCEKTETINPKLNPENEFVYIDVSSVNKETKIIEETTILMGRDAPSRARKLVKTNDVIFATVRPTHQRVAIISDTFNNQVCSTGYYVLRAKEFIHHKIIYYFILSSNFNEEMKKLQKGASYPAVTNKEVETRIISFPKSIQEQKRIVAQLDRLQAETKKLEFVYQQKLDNLEELKKSVLQKAFRGEL